jgi:ferric-dicitrate binding protein FerR (iron transport regulator)
MSRHEVSALWAYAAGELSAEGAARVEKHLSECAGCRAELEAVRASQRLLQSARQAPAPEVDWARVTDGVNDAAARRAAFRPGWLRLALAGGMAAALALGGVWLVRWPSGQAPEASPEVTVGPASVVEGAREAARGPEALAPGTRVNSGDVVETSAAGHAVLRLPEESRVRLAPASSVRLAAARRETVKLVLDRGRLTAQASHTAERTAFEVRAGAVVVRVVGTVFSVAASPREVSVAVAEGKVKVEWPGQSRAVKAGERLVVAGGAGRAAAFSAQDRAEFGSMGVELTARPAAAPVPPEPPSVPAASPAEPTTVEPTTVVEVETPAGAEEGPAGDMERLFLRRAEDGLRAHRCQGFLVGLQDVAESSEDAQLRQRARILRARCFDDLLRPVEAEGEYRRYLQEFPQGDYSSEARRSIGD